MAKLDVFIKGEKVAFTYDRLLVTKIPEGWRFSRTIKLPEQPPGQALQKILQGLAKDDFYVPSEDEQGLVQADLDGAGSR
jgi:hypothetical protein